MIKEDACLFSAFRCFACVAYIDGYEMSLHNLETLLFERVFLLNATSTLLPSLPSFFNRDVQM